MSCYHPLLGVPKEKNENGKYTYSVIGKYDPIAKSLDPRVISIPCGRCIGCKLDYSRSWADRMMLELQHTGKAIFVTLTYDEDCVPKVFECDLDTGETGDAVVTYTLNKRDLQLFLKRLRKKYNDKEIRYYAAGEYGRAPQTGQFPRPHYHVILFGLCLDDFPDRQLRGRNELGQLLYTSETFQRVWNQGFVVLAEVSWKTCAYVARYVQKKAIEGEVMNVSYGATPEFSEVSRRPGLGAFFLDDHPDLFDLSQIFVSGYDKGIKIPKYFLKKLSLIDPEKYDMISNERRQFVDDRIFLKMQQTDLSFQEQLALEENEKLSKMKVLKRLL